MYVAAIKSIWWDHAFLGEDRIGNKPISRIIKNRMNDLPAEIELDDRINRELDRITVLVFELDLRSQHACCFITGVLEQIGTPAGCSAVLIEVIQRFVIDHWRRLSGCLQKKVLKKGSKKKESSKSKKKKVSSKTVKRKPAESAKAADEG